MKSLVILAQGETIEQRSGTNWPSLSNADIVVRQVAEGQFSVIKDRTDTLQATVSSVELMMAVVGVGKEAA